MCFTVIGGGGSGRNDAANLWRETRASRLMAIAYLLCDSCLLISTPYMPRVAISFIITPEHVQPYKARRGFGNPAILLSYAGLWGTLITQGLEPSIATSFTPNPFTLPSLISFPYTDTLSLTGCQKDTLDQLGLHKNFCNPLL